MHKNFIFPAAILAGTIIGAGVFALPYVFEEAGSLTGLFYLFIFGVVLSLIHLMYGDIILTTEGDRRLAGYAEIYLGKTAKWLAALTTILGMILVLTVYLILSLSFFNLFYPSLWGGYKVLVFWLLGSLAIFWKPKRLAWSEFLLTFAILFIIFFIFIYGGSGMQNLWRGKIFNPSYLFLPYGAILFALSGRAAVPAVILYFKKRREYGRSIKKAIVAGTMIPALAYLFFTLGILGISNAPSVDAVSGIVGKVPYPLLILMGLLGLIALWTTYIVVARDIKESISSDFGLRGSIAGAAVVLLPILLYFSGFQNFLGLINLVGGVFLGLEGMLVVLIWRKSTGRKQKSILLARLPALIPYLLLFIFGLGIILTIRQ